MSTDGRYRHASGDDSAGCMACWGDQYDDGEWDDVSDIRPCTTPEPDPAETGRCRWCSHTVERAA